MWWNKQKNKRITKIDSLIGKQTEIQGDLSFKGGLHIDGKLKGDISADDKDKEAVLILSIEGEIMGDIRVPHVVINGKVHGDVHATEHLELAPEAHITGDVYYNLLEMTIGSEVNGKLIHHYPPDVRDQNTEADTIESILTKESIA